MRPDCVVAGCDIRRCTNDRQFPDRPARRARGGLVVSILIAYLVKTGRRELLPRIWLGVGLAVAVSLGFGAVLTFGPSGLTFEAQEMIGGRLSIIAVGFVTWMMFWMASAAAVDGRRAPGQGRQGRRRGRWALVLVAVLAVGREGLETALFLWAATQATGADGSSTAGAPARCRASVSRPPSCSAT